MNKYQEALNGVQIIPEKVVVRKIEDEILMERCYMELQELVDKHEKLREYLNKEMEYMNTHSDEFDGVCALFCTLKLEEILDYLDEE